MATRACRLHSASVPRCASSPSFHRFTTPSSALGSTTAVPYVSSHQASFLAANADGPTASSNAGVAPDPKIDWNTFFHLRKIRRRYNLAASAGSTVGTTSLGVSVLSRQDLMDMIGAQFGDFNPFVILGILTAGCGVVGWLAGPLFGSAVFSLLHKDTKASMTMKEREFYGRIKRYRVDPSSQSLSNPVPDYYGEKIGSVRGYRQWLKDQRAYNKKRQSFL
ncbi:MAG: TIM23 complex component [Piccolia ochrophora]|nr:MAG: TIM23 complex component [Piccolia ochrophora]